MLGLSSRSFSTHNEKVKTGDLAVLSEESRLINYLDWVMGENF